MDAASLTEAQRDGVACVVCGGDMSHAASVPVATVDGGQVFACASHECTGFARDGEWIGCGRELDESDVPL